MQLDNLAFEETQVSFADYSLLEEILPCELVPVMGLIEELREVKDEEEVAIIEKACAIADQGFAFVLEMIKPGMTEIEVANQLDFFMRSKEPVVFLLRQLWPAVYVQRCHMALLAIKSSKR